MAGSRYGRESMHAPETDELAKLWEEAREANGDIERSKALKPIPASIPPEWHPLTTEFAPVSTIRVVEAILPRDALSPDAVDRYVIDFEQLPPIEVQKETFTLIGGHHRLEAAIKRGEHLIQIVECDVKDEDLREAAFVSNRNNAVPMKMSERLSAARYCLERHPDWADGVIAGWAGVNRSTVMTWRHKAEESATEGPSLAGGRQVDVGTSTRVGKDGVTRTRREPPPHIERKPSFPNPVGSTGGKAGSFNAVPKPQPTTARANVPAAFGTSGTEAHPAGDSAELPGSPAIDQAQAFETLVEAVLAQGPRSFAEEVPEDLASAALTLAMRLSTWLDEYKGALQERMAVGHHARGNGGPA